MSCSGTHRRSLLASGPGGLAAERELISARTLSRFFVPSSLRGWFCLRKKIFDADAGVGHSDRGDEIRSAESLDRAIAPAMRGRGVVNRVAIDLEAMIDKIQDPVVNQP